MIRSSPKQNRTGFTLVELVVVIVVIIVLLAVFIWPNMVAVRERAQRVECFDHMNGTWKAISAWGLSPEDSYSPGIIGTNSIDALKKMSPDVLICPEAGRLCKTKPDTNCYYQFYSGRRDVEGDQVIICDMNGPNQIAGPNAWGGNHGGKGGNIVKVAGSGQWVDSTNYPGRSCITNREFSEAFANNGMIMLDWRACTALEDGKY